MNILKTKNRISILGKTIETDWMILACFLFSVLIIGLLMSWFFYKNVSDQSFLSEEQKNPVSSLKVNTEQLDKVIKDLADKKEKFNNLTGGMILSDTIIATSTANQ